MRNAARAPGGIQLRLHSRLVIPPQRESEVFARQVLLGRTGAPAAHTANARPVAALGGL